MNRRISVSNGTFPDLNWLYSRDTDLRVPFDLPGNTKLILTQNTNVVIYLTLYPTVGAALSFKKRRDQYDIANLS